MEHGNENNEKGDLLVPNETVLLQKLEEQNKLLEEDHRFLTHNCRTAGSTSDSASMHSADSLGSLRNSSHTPAHDTVLTPPHKSPLSPLLTSELLESPTEVRSKPLPPTSYESNYNDNESHYKDTESDSDDIGIGPSACIVLDDEYETRIDYEEVVPVREIPQDVVNSKVGVSNFVVRENELIETFRAEPPHRGLKKLSAVTSTSDVMLILDEEEGNKERDDTLGADKPSITSSVRRRRSESESTVNRKLSLSSLVHMSGPRKRTLTVVEGNNTIIEVPEEEPVETPPEAKPELTEEEELWQKWSELLRNWEESVKKKMSVIKILARQGIPDPLRGMAWQLLSNSQNTDLKEQYPALITEDSPFERAIQRDLARTFPEHSFFKESDGLGQEGLMNILKAYSIFDREVGYCQGSPFITGLLLMKMPEEDAFCVFVRLMKTYKLRELFKPSMADLGLCFYQLEKCIEDLFPELYMHFRAVGFQTSMYASPWFLTMYASVLSLNVVFRIMDIFLLEGREIIFRVGLALIEYSLDRLLRGDLEDILKYFQKELKSVHEANPENLIERALKIKYNSKKMRKVEKEYLARKEKQAQESKEITRLQAENSDLQQRVYALEKECASLADRLIQGQVTLAEEAEERFILKKKLSIAERKVTQLEMPATDEGAGEHFILVKTPIHVCREEAEQVLRQLGAASPGTSPKPAVKLNDSDGDFPQGIPLLDKDDPEPNSPKEKLSQKAKIKKRFSTKLSHKTDSDSKQKDKKKNKDGEVKVSDDNILSPVEVKEVKGQDRSISPSPSPTPQKKHKRKKSKSLSGDLTFELAKVKLQCADTAHQLEHKSLELNKALHREGFVVRELKTAKEHIMELEQQLEFCPHCGHSIHSNDKVNSNLSDSAPSPDNLPSNQIDPKSSGTDLLAQVQALWTQKTENRDCVPTENDS